MKVFGIAFPNLNKAAGSSARRKQTAPAEAGAVVKRPEDKIKVRGSQEGILSFS